MIKLYKIFFPIFFMPIIFVLSLFSKKIRSGIKEKSGFYNFKMSEKTLWIHAVSVGEINALADFIINNKQRKITLTTSTPQGFELANKKLSDFCEKICYYPFDTTFAVSRAIEAINPYAVMIFETEIWPNFSSILNSRKTPIFIANARISDSTFKTYKKLKFFFKNVFENFTGILAQSKEDAEKFIEIGANPEIVQIMGNIKFDIKCPDENIKTNLQNYYKAGETPVIVAGSTHKGEDEVIINLFKKLKQKCPIKLIIAPRHLERIKQISILLKNNKLDFALKTSGRTFKDTDIILLDTTGELSDLYSISKFSIICGCFDKTGGHNPLEATIWAKPVISGSNVKNFKVIYRELVKNNCAKIVNSETELENVSTKLLKDEKYWSQMCENSVETISKSQGATKFLEKYIGEILK